MQAVATPAHPANASDTHASRQMPLEDSARRDAPASWVHPAPPSAVSHVAPSSAALGPAAVQAQMNTVQDNVNRRIVNLRPVGWLTGAADCR
jgi:hypothetical protein